MKVLAVTILFGAIAYFEYRYLRRHKRSKRSFRRVLGFLSVLWVFGCIVTVIPDRIRLGVVIANLVEPLQRLLFVS